MIDKKENVIGTRVNEKMFKSLHKYANENNMKLSKLTRDALYYYNNFVISRRNQGIPIIILGKNEYATIVEYLNDDGLKRVAEVCFNNAFKSLEQAPQKEGFDIDELEVSPRVFMQGLKYGVFSHEGQNWFKTFEYRFTGKNYIMLAGVHDINHNFSVFIKYFFIKTMEYFKYEIIEDKEVLRKEKVVLHFQKEVK